MTINRLFQIVYAAQYVLLAVLALFAVRLVGNQRNLEKSHESRHASYLLAEELRDSSEDLTRMARSYVATGRPIFEQSYRRILAIRNGTEPRPEHYQLLDWNAVPSVLAAPGPDARAVPLQTLMEDLGFTDAELAKLQEAQQLSDALVRTEEIAMNAMKGFEEDGAGRFTKQGQPNQEMAVRLMFDEDYHLKKAAILKPIDEFFTMLDDRTAANAERYIQQNHRILYSILGMLLVLAVTAGASWSVIGRNILRPIVALQCQAEIVAADLGRLTDVTNEIAGGRSAQTFSVGAKPIRLGSLDELGQLARTYDNMIACLQKAGSSVVTMGTDLVDRGCKLERANQELEAKNSLVEAAQQAAEAAHRAQREQFVELEQLYATAPVGLGLMDRNFRVHRLNERLAAVSGKPIHEQLGRTLWEINPEVAPRVEAIVNQVFETGEPVLNIELHGARSADPDAGRDWLMSHYPVNSPDGTPRFVGTVVLDITQRKRTEEALAESNRFARSALDALSTHIAILDERGLILHVNEAWRKFAVANSAQTDVGVGADYLDVCDRATGPSDEEAAAVAAGIRAIIRGEQTEFTLEYPCHSPEEKRWFLARVTRFEGDGPVRVVVSHENVTVAKLADEERQKFVSLVENSIDFIGMATLFGDVFYLNPAACKLVGLDAPLGEIGIKITEFYSEAGQRFRNDIIQPALASAGQWAGENQYRHFQTGQPIDIQHSVFTVRHPTTGEPLCIATVAHDITVQKRDEEALRLNVAAMEAAANGIAITDVKGTLQWANPAFTKMTGYSAAEARGQNMRFLKSEKQSPDYYEQLWKTIAAGQVWHGELVNKRKDGSLYDEELTITPVRDAAGQVTHFVAIKQDITERKRADEALRESEGWYRTLFVEAHDGICLVDAKTGLIIECNQALVALVGRDKAELIGQPQTVLHPPANDNELFSPTFKQHLGDQAGHILDTQVVSKTGDIKEVAIRARTLNIAGREVMQGLFRDITLQKQAEAKLNDARALLDSALSAIPDVFYVFDISGKFLLWNKAFARITGYSDQELSSMQPADFFSGQDVQRISESIGRTWKGGDSQQEADFVVKDGTQLPYEFTASILRDGAGNAIGFSGTGRDLTERKRAADKLAHFAAIVNSSQDAIIGKTVDGIITSWNVGAERLYGYTAEEVVGQSILVLLPPSRLDELLPLLVKIKQGERLEQYDTIRRCKDGTLVDVSLTLSPITNFHGEIVGISTVTRNITDRKKAEEQALIFRRFAEASGQGIGMATLQGHILYWNPKLCQMYDEDNLEDVYKKDIFEYYPPEFREQFLNEIMPKVMGEGQWVGELTPVSAKGKHIPTIENVFLIRDEKGRPIRLAVVITDITERREMEDDLRKAKDEAQAANRAKSEFVANMSHEIRTPMNGVIGLTELAMDTELSAEQRQYLEGIATSGNALLQVIDDVLDFSKIEAGKLDIDAIDFDLSAAVESAVESMALRAHEKGLELLCDISSEVPDELIGDPARLRQVLINLVGNAVKFTSQGEVVVVVERKRVTKDAVWLKFTVSDTGIGVPADRQEVIFEAFKQVDGSTTRNYGGTGLGLTISARLVRLMGGRLQIESEPGTGSRFYFTIPFDRTRQEKGTAAAASFPVKLDGLRVLVVDDNATNRRILLRTLSRWGVQATEADSGASALACLHDALAKKVLFELILLDVCMPGMDGFAVLEQIRREPDLDRPAILMLSSIDRSKDVARARELGASAYLFKPAHWIKLRDAIGQALAVADDTKAERESSVPGDSRPEQPPVGRRLRILVAEDNPVNQLFAVRTLEKAGHEAIVAKNGEAALALLESRDFDLALMDVQMPAMDGYQATARIRERERGTERHLPIIAMTAHAMKGDREHCLEMGMDGYVSKPFTKRTLLRAIEAVLSPQPVETIDAERTAPHDLDHQAFLGDTMAHDPDFLRELSGMFLEDCPHLMTNIREAIDGREASDLKLAAHTLKGSVGVFKDQAAFDAAFQMERIGRGADWENAEIVWTTLTAETDRLSEALSALVGAKELDAIDHSAGGPLRSGAELLVRP